MGTGLDLDLWGHRLQVRAAAPEAASALRGAISDHELSEPAPLGFVVKAPDTPDGLHSLVDRSGLVLARARSWQDCIAVLAELLATFAPPPEGTIRTTMRAVIRGEGPERGAALVGFPLLSLPPMVERQLDRRGQWIVDRLAIDMTPDGDITLSSSPWPQLRPEEPVGHCGAGASGAPIDTVLVPANVGSALRRYQFVALIASTIASVTVDAALDAAERLVDRARAVPMNDAAARRRALDH